jgi:hypothetical protein
LLRWQVVRRPVPGRQRSNYKHLFEVDGGSRRMTHFLAKAPTLDAN